MGSSTDRPLSNRTWAVWLAATLLTFAGLEAHAVATRRAPTLSHSLRVWLGIQPARRHGRIAGALFTAFWAWLCLHIALGIGPNLRSTR